MLHKGYYRYSEGFCAARLLYRVNWGNFTSKNVSEINIIQILARDVSPVSMILHIHRRTITHDSSSGGGWVGWGWEGCVCCTYCAGSGFLSLSQSSRRWLSQRPLPFFCSFWMVAMVSESCTTSMKPLFSPVARQP